MTRPPVFAWTYRKRAYRIVPITEHLWAQIPKPPYVLLDAQGQVLSGITERELRWYRQRIKEVQGRTQ